MLSALEVDELYDTARECSQIAANMCREFRRDSMNAQLKADKTWVTAADLSIERKLREFLKMRRTDDSILGEEEGGEWGKENQITWILDPIDGTFSFVHGIPFYSSLIAVAYGKTPIIGFAALPGLDITMSAVKGRGAKINNIPYVAPSSNTIENIEIVATADVHRFRMEGHNGVLQKLYGPDFKARTYPDALGYYLLLNGSVRAFVDPKIEVWDVAPFHVILPEAGCVIRPWHASEGLARGTSVAYRVTGSGEPMVCDDVLEALR